MIKLYPDWKSRAVTLLILVGGALITALSIYSIIAHDTPLPLWLLALACLIFLGVYLVVYKLATKLTGIRGYLLDLIMSIPAGFLFLAKDSALPSLTTVGQ